MEDLDSEELSKFLTQHMESDLAKKLKDQKIKGKDFMNLSHSTLKLFGFTLGDVLEINSLQEKLKSGQLKYTPLLSVCRNTENPGHHLSLNARDDHRKPSSDNDSDVNHGFDDMNAHDHRKPSSDNDSDVNHGFDDMNAHGDHRKPSNDNDNGSNVNHGFDDIDSLDLDESRDSGDDVSDSELLDWMSQEELSDLSSYNKKGLKSNLQNFKQLKERGLTNLSIPSGFSVFKKSRDKEARAKKSAPSSSKQNKKSGGHASTATRSSARLRGSAPRVQLVAPINEPSDEECDSNKENAPEEPKDMYKPDAAHLKRTRQELLELKPHLGEIDVAAILKEHKSTKDCIARWLDEGFVLAVKDRKKAYRVLVRHLSYKVFSHPSEVKTEHLERLAKSFCCTYIQYQKPIDSPNSTPWSHIYSPAANKGHFANIRKRIQTALPDDERDRKTKVKKKNPDNSPVPGHDVDIEALAVMWPGRGERDQIIDAMQKTFGYRQNQRKKGSSITDMIKEFPQFHNYNGELISNEFGLMFPKAKDMCPLFLKHIPKIQEMWPTMIRKSSSVDTTAQACYALACKLPHVPRGGSEEDTDTTVLPVEKELIVIKSPKVDIAEYAEGRREQEAGPVQPYLIGIKSDLTSDIMKYFLVLDGRPMELGKIPTIRAIDWVFKACCVFNVYFPPSWTNFFRLLQTCYYEVYLTNEDDAPASAIEYFKILHGV